ncbi:hypothetical protein KJ866_02925 [Patescibacteria group bacterium]|nr:hypothetical protein [Patescibacteria group bacterium]
MAWNTYKGKCSKCGMEIVRHDRRQYGFCRGCDTFLKIPSYNSAEEISVYPVQIQIEEGGEQLEMTRQVFADIWETIRFFCVKMEEAMVKKVEGKIGHCPACGEEIKRISFQGPNEWRNCGFCGRKISIPGDLTKKIKLVLVRVDNKVRVPKHMVPLIAEAYSSQ